MTPTEKGCERMNSKKKIILIILILAILLGCCGGLMYLNKHYIKIGNQLYSRDTAELDLSGNRDLDLQKLLELTDVVRMDLRETGMDTRMYLQLQQGLPGCEILWSVPFQNDYVDSTAKELVLKTISEADLDDLAYFPELESVDARGIWDYELIAAMMTRYPQLTVSYEVQVAGNAYSHDVAQLKLKDADAEEMKQRFGYLRELNQVTLEGQLPEAAALQELTEAYPNIQFYWQWNVLGTSADNRTTELTLTDLTAEQLETVKADLAYLPGLQQVHVTGKLPEAWVLQDLVAAYPQIQFYWQIELFGITADVHTEELDFSEIKMESVDIVENALGYLPSLKKVIMSNCGISNEDMDALWKRNPEVRFIWTVRVGAFYLRTDETAFMPGKYRMLPKGDECYNLRYLVDMECLDLGHCKIDDCEFVAYMPNLKYLLLALTNISDITPIANHDKLVYLELFTCRKLTDYTPLLTLTALEDLNICYTYGDIEIIAQMTWLKNLWWSAGKNNKAIAKEREKILSEALPNTYLELDTQSSTAEGWRQLPHYYEQRDIFEMPYFTA